MKKQTWLDPGNDDSISSEVIGTQTEQFLALFSRTLNFFCALIKDAKISWQTIVLIARGCFDRTHGWNKLFLHLMRALCLCLLLMSYLVFFQVYY